MDVGDKEFRGAAEVGDGVRRRFGVRASTATMALEGVAVGAVADEEGKDADMAGGNGGKYWGFDWRRGCWA